MRSGGRGAKGVGRCVCVGGRRVRGGRRLFSIAVPHPTHPQPSAATPRPSKPHPRRIRSGAPDAAAARESLSEMLAEMLGRLALMTMTTTAAGTRWPIMDLTLLPLDAEAAATVAADTHHWTYAAEQLALAPEQRERVAALLRMHRVRALHFAAVRRELAARVAAEAEDVQLQEELVWELQRAQSGYAISSTSTMLALWGTLITVEQGAAFSGACWPHCPSLTALTDVILAAEEDLEIGGEDGGAGMGASGGLGGLGGGCERPGSAPAGARGAG